MKRTRIISDYSERNTLVPQSFGVSRQIGMYGSMILKKRENDPTFRKGIDDLPTVPVMLSEWTDLKPKNIQRMLHNANDWAGIKKGSTQSYAEAIREGHFETKITNEWKRMLAMDVSDVYYEKFLMNAQNESRLKQFKAGDESPFTNFERWCIDLFLVALCGMAKLPVVANDGNDVRTFRG